MFRALCIACIVGLAGLAPPDARAQDQLLTQYVADLGPEDHVNSKGQRLGSFAALLAQDRANYHRFGIRHRSDGADPIFSSRAMRAQITAAIVEVPDYYQPYVDNVMSSDGSGGTYMVVKVFGSGKTISKITIDVPG